MSIPINLKSADGVKVFLSSFHIFDVMDSVIIGQFEEKSAKEAALRESIRIFGKECEIFRPLRRLLCFLDLVSYEYATPDVDGSQMLVCLPLTVDSFHVLMSTIADQVLEIVWKDKAQPFSF